MESMEDYNNNYNGNENKGREQDALKNLLALVIIASLALFIMTLCSACTTTEYIPVIEHHTDTLIQTKVKKDSIYLHDSISVWQKGDTVTIDRWHTKYVQKEMHDTTYIAKRDTVPQPYPVEVIKEVPAQLTWWQQTRLHLANIVLWLLVVLAVIYVGKKHLARLVQD
jgi:hypothetical protein